MDNMISESITGMKHTNKLIYKMLNITEAQIQIEMNKINTYLNTINCTKSNICKTLILLHPESEYVLEINELLHKYNMHGTINASKHSRRTHIQITSHIAQTESIMQEYDITNDSHQQDMILNITIPPYTQRELTHRDLETLYTITHNNLTNIENAPKCYLCSKEAKCTLKHILQECTYLPLKPMRQQWKNGIQKLDEQTHNIINNVRANRHQISSITAPGYYTNQDKYIYNILNIISIYNKHRQA